MGHELCGAVTAAAHVVENPDVLDTPGINKIIRDLMPAILQAKKETGLEGEELVEAAARENVRMACRQIYQNSGPLHKLSDSGEVKIIGAYKQLSSGVVEFFE
jgi:carbonic anhydrase